MSDPTDHPDSPDSTDEASPREKPMGFWEHLEELRGVIIKSVLVFIVGATIAGIWMQEMNDILLWPLRAAQQNYPELVLDLTNTTIMEPFNIIIQICVTGGLVLATPFILFFIASFVAPALTEKEMKAVIPVCTSAVLLFVVGACFAFFLLIPNTLTISVSLSQQLHFAMRWTPGSYYSLLMWLVLGVGASFEFPLLIVLLVWVGVMTTAFLRKYRRHAIVAIFVLAAVVTPTPDPVTQTMFAGPLYVLYEIAILASSRIEKRKQKLRLFG